jgi:hypothetical protein
MKTNFSENQSKHTNVMCGKNVVFWNVKAVSTLKIHAVLEGKINNCVSY